MRLFTAIDLDPDARTAIAAEQQRIAADLGGAPRTWRFVRAEHLHLTLVFIGEIAEDRAPAIIEVMQPDIPLPPFQLVFGGYGTFPPRGAPRILWLGTLGGALEAIDLHALVAERLAGVGVPADPRPYRPHLTLVRWRENGRRSDAIRLKSDPASGGRASVVARVDVQAVTLYQSRLSSAGPTYTALTQAQLSARGPREESASFSRCS